MDQHRTNDMKFKCVFSEKILLDEDDDDHEENAASVPRPCK